MSRRPRALFEIYDEGFDTARSWGGVETSLWYLTEGMRATGIDVRFYPRSSGSPAEVAALIERDPVDAVVPLVESDVFAGRGLADFPGLYSRVVRIWHDVSRLAGDLSTPRPCAAHTSPGDKPCVAAALAPNGPMTEVFLRDAPWTRCFSRRHCIPWAADHLPATDERDPDGPVVLQLGKVDNESAERCVRRIVAHGRPLRLIFSGWSRLGRQARSRFAGHADLPSVEVIDSYDIRTDWRAVLAGARVLVLPTRFHETFNFLAAESVQVGVPVVTTRDVGELARFASWQARDLDELVHRLLTEDAPIPPRRRSELGWAEVSRRFASLVGEPA